MNTTIQLNQSQKEAFEKFLFYKRGIIIMPTGSGKTLVGVEVCKHLSDDKILIVVNTLDLIQQWRNFLNGYSITDIGIVSGKSKDFMQRITITTINSVRNLKAVHFNLLIGDEAHHLASPKAKDFLKKNAFDKILFLTATIKRSDNEERFLIEELKIPIIYNYKQQEAINDKLLNKYDLILQGIYLDTVEEQEYERLHNYILANFSKYNYDYMTLQISASRRDFSAIELIKVFNRRKSLMLKANNKIIETAVLLSRHINDKVLVFTEDIEMANKIYQTIKFKEKCSLYHSGINDVQREKILDNFKNNSLNALISCRCLDEGLNIPEANIAIIVSGNSTKRQSIQRIGRVIRFVEGKQSIVYMLYCRNTKEEEWIANRIQGLAYENKYWR